MNTLKFTFHNSFAISALVLVFSFFLVPTTQAQSPWEVDASQSIYHLDYKVGIGTKYPKTRLMVVSPKREDIFSLNNEDENFLYVPSYGQVERDQFLLFYDPDPSIIMSYAIGCRNRFTQGQISRMMATLIVNLPQVLVSDNDLSLHSQVISIGESLQTARETIRAGNLVPAITSDYYVRWGAYVTHTAGDRVLLEPGFRAQPTSNGFYMASVKNAFCNEVQPRLASSTEETGRTQNQHMNANIETQGQHRNAAPVSDFSLQTYPNPFKNHIKVAFQLPSSQKTSIIIFNTMGKLYI